MGSGRGGRRSRRAHTPSRLPFPLPSSQATRLGLLAGVFAMLVLFGGSAQPTVNWLLLLRPVLIFAIAISFLVPATGRGRDMKVPAILLILLAASIAVQLVPLPPSMWTGMPGHDRYAEAALAAGIEQPWRPISLTPWWTWNSLFALLPAAAMLVVLARLGRNSENVLVPAYLLFVGVSVVLGVAQVASVFDGPPTPYRYIDDGSPVGFFTNRNHAGAFLATAFPALRLWSLRNSSSGRRQAIAAVAALVVLVTIVVNGSRSGMAVGVVSLVLSIGMAPLTELGRKWGKKKARLASIVAIAVPLVLILVLVLFGKALSLDRIINDNLGAEQRVVFLPLLIAMTKGFFPFGSGFGSFDPVFRSYEPDWGLGTKYFNHAHNDLIELAMTGGLFAVLVLVALLAWMAWRLWQTRGDALARETISVRAGFIMAACLLAASLTDYPLRGPLAGGIFVFALWLMCPRIGHGGERESGEGER